MSKGQFAERTVKYLQYFPQACGIHFLDKASLRNRLWNPWM